MEQGNAIPLFVVLFLSAYSCCSNNCTATDEQQGKPQSRVGGVAGARNRGNRLHRRRRLRCRLRGHSGLRGCRFRRLCLDGELAHELGHIILHRSQLKMAPMQDDTLYNMTDNTEYQANLFAADLLIDDEEIEDMVQNEDLDYFGLCSSLNATPELMSFKLYSLTKRGQAYHMPMEIQSNFLAK